MFRKAKERSAATGCEYCEHPERYNLGPATLERIEERSPLDKVIRFASWHYEAVVYCRDVPRMRIRCQKNDRSGRLP